MSFLKQVLKKQAELKAEAKADLLRKFNDTYELDLFYFNRVKFILNKYDNIYAMYSYLDILADLHIQINDWRKKRDETP